MEIPKGALISQIIKDSPAEKSGLKEEDVILSFDGEEIFYSADLPQTVGSIKPDSQVTAVVLRDGKKKSIRVKVGELPQDPQGLAASAGINKGDIIYSIRKMPVENVVDFNDALKKLESGKTVSFGVARNGIKRITPIKLPK